MTPSFISLLESGDRDIGGVSYNTVVRIAHALGVEPQDLWPVLPSPLPDEPPETARDRQKGRGA